MEFLKQVELSLQDIFALAWFLAAWGCYSVIIQTGGRDRQPLSRLMDLERLLWMHQCARREVRIFDSQIIIGLGQGAAFFASTSLLALGGALTLFQIAEMAAKLFSNLPLNSNSSLLLWEIKTLGLVVIFAFCFFKFGWSYRLFNYTSILMGAMPTADEIETQRGRAAVYRAGRMMTNAGRHFNAGQRGLFLSIGYMCWYFGPGPFVIGTSLVIGVLVRRQFFSEAREASLIKKDEIDQLEWPDELEGKRSDDFPLSQ